MATPTSVLSKTLQSITLTKIRELESRRNSYETRKRNYLNKADTAADQRDRLECLLEAFKELSPAAAKDGSLTNIERWLTQSRYDASVPTSKLASFDGRLRTKMDIQSRKLDMAHLYSRLLTEWMEMDQLSSAPSANLATETDEDAFEVVVERQRQRLSQLVDKFEAVVFEPRETSDSEIRSFLDNLFPDEESQTALEKLRGDIAEASEDLMNETAPFDDESLTNCIKGLLTEDILSDEKQAILRDFLESDVAKVEISDVLNMRYSDLKHWHWDAGKDGIRVMPRAGLNGKYRIWADDDILQMIFVQFIGIRLCNILKPILTEFMKQLPGSETALFDGDYNYDGEDRNDGSSEDDDDWAIRRSKRNKRSSQPKEAPPKKSGIKQKLLRQLTTELITHRLRAPKRYATSISHSTIYSVLEYVGFGEDWISFFRKYLEAPLNLDAASDDRPQLGPRIRKRGVPMAHASEKFIGELVLFFMDLAVNRKTGILLYRLHDDIWICGEPERSAQAWTYLE
ncbi:hypothetical protein B0T25DRAFT_522006 [Lasiosphaeria hispida]|uniref:Reverse transcriptase domain-containing protein n=1 Tax=Lasiosphaeria hispida TaxID=260671 RepID=A0AAJ0H8W6_9PEZI|nr:hypothetical protein B0T25DRAFT_522006 [Lasiosphaeria hispida]